MRVHHPGIRLLATVVAGSIGFVTALGLLVGGAAVVATAPRSRGVSVQPLRELAARSTIVDRDGTVMGRLGVQDREDVPLDSVPQVLRDAVVAVEDATFWTNRGIDLVGIGRAAISNLRTGEVTQGGSTITQQLVKNRILSAKRTAKRKAREVVLALAYSDRYSKRRILEQYLNTVYFGQGAYGVKTAAERFFATVGPDGRTEPGRLDTLTVGQAALLAGSIANPEGFNPFRFPERAQARRAFVLERMADDGYITPAEASAAAREPLPSVLPPPDLRPRSAWVEEVQDQLLNDPRFAMLGTTIADRERRLLTGGLTVETTLDPHMQAAAEQAVAETLPAERPDFTAAIVAIEPPTGAVRAMASGTDFQTLQYNLATSRPGRQPGSTWKVITLAAALEAGASPVDVVDGSSPCEFPGLLGRTENFEPGAGAMTLRAAMIGSVNCAFARVQLVTGFSHVIDAGRRLGLRQDTLQPILTLTLGSIESTPLEMATVAATLANQGLRSWPSFVERIRDRRGAVIFERSASAERVMAPEVTACVTDILQEVVARGTGTNARLAGGRAAAGKTGTTDERSDANFLGYTPDLAAFVWYGNPGWRAPGAGFGGDVPARVFKRFMDQALADRPATGFPDPGPVCRRPENPRPSVGPPPASEPDARRPPTPAPASPPSTAAPAAPPPRTTPPSPPTTASPPPPTTTPPGPGSVGSGGAE